MKIGVHEVRRCLGVDCRVVYRHLVKFDLLEDAGVTKRRTPCGDVSSEDRVVVTMCEASVSEICQPYHHKSHLCSSGIDLGLSHCSCSWWRCRDKSLIPLRFVLFYSELSLHVLNSDSVCYTGTAGPGVA